MNKNQHVVPHPDGGWQVKGEGNSRATVRTEKRLSVPEASLRIRVPN